jgi:hypothetical protein
MGLFLVRARVQASAFPVSKCTYTAGCKVVAAIRILELIQVGGWGLGQASFAGRSSSFVFSPFSSWCFSR